MEDLKKNKLALGIGITALVGVATVLYLYNKKRSSEEGGQVQRTFAFIKPDAFDQSDAILKQVLAAGFTIVKSRRITLTQEQAELFYVEHKGKPFFQELVNHMISGPVMALMLERQNAVRYWRDTMGETNPDVAKTKSPNSIRAQYGTSITKNAVHGSDSLESAERELGFFFDD